MPPKPTTCAGSNGICRSRASRCVRAPWNTSDCRLRDRIRARDCRPIYGPFEAGLDRFVDLEKSEFIGRSAAAEEKESGGALRLVSFKVDATDADAIGDEPIWHDGKTVGWVTSGAFGHRVNHSLALGYVPASLAKADVGFEIEIIGERHQAHRLTGAAFDSSGQLMRT